MTNRNLPHIDAEDRYFMYSINKRLFQEYLYQEFHSGFTKYVYVLSS